MNTNDIALLYISYVETKGGKKRPVLVYAQHDDYLEVMSITSKYQNKSEYIKKKYYPIMDWEEAGLRKESWIDIGNIHVFMKDTLKGVKVISIGRLTKRDILGLDKFSQNLN